MGFDQEKPWSEGAAEILIHAYSVLRSNTDSGRRIAFICIDNAVELMMKTYLGLPKRMTKCALSKREYEEISASFSSLVDAMAQHCPEKLAGIDPSILEWFHRLRNHLYHQGAGVSFSQDKTEMYAQLGNVLFKNLFGYDSLSYRDTESELLRDFLEAWVHIEAGVRESADRNSLVGFRPGSFDRVLTYLKDGALLERSHVAEIKKLREIRNKLIHGEESYRHVLTPEVVKKAGEYAEMFGDC